MGRHQRIRDLQRGYVAPNEPDPKWTDINAGLLSRSELIELKQYLIANKNFIDERGRLTLLDKLSPQLMLAVKHNDQDPAYRTIAVDSLVLWISRVNQMLAQNPQHIGEFRQILGPQQSDYLYHYLLTYWSDSGSALGSALKDMFVKLIQYLGLVDPEPKKTFESWLREVLEIPTTMRVLYLVVDNLYKKMDDPNFVLNTKPAFIRDVLSSIWSNAVATNAGKCIALLLNHSYDPDHEEQWLDTWSDDVIASLQPKLRQGVELYLLPHLFKISKTATNQFLKRVEALGDMSLLLGCLALAQNASVISEPFDGDDAIVPLSKMEELFVEDNDYFKVRSLALLLTSPKRTTTIKPYLYDVAYSSLDQMFCEQKVNNRDEMFSLLKKFVLRIRDSTHRLDKERTKLGDVDGDIDLGKRFLDRLLAKSLWYLKPGSFHQYKSFAYKILKCLIESGLDPKVDSKYHDKSKMVSYPFAIDIYTRQLQRIMIDNISDNYEDNRKSSIQILSMSPVPIPQDMLEQASNRAMAMISDMKGKDVDSGSRFYSFLFQHYQRVDKEACKELLQGLEQELEARLQNAKTDFASACFESSVHGYFATFKLIFQEVDYTQLDLQDLTSRLIEACSQSWETIKPILQHDSPEGNLPEGVIVDYSADLESKYGRGTQVISSYSWRALKESSGMIESFIVNAPLTDAQLEAIGPFLMQQLATIRHRGAFSAVYPTFVACCVRCSTINGLTSKWLDQNIDQILAESNFITRRSAGLPYLITGILTADPSLFDSTMARLFEIAQLPVPTDQTLEDVNLPQVNAFNCIKAIFVDSALSDDSVRYVNEGLKLSLDQFDSPVWAIRNCAVMLFTALENRMFSSGKLRHNSLPSYQSRLFFSRYEGIKETFADTLKHAVESGLDDRRQVEKVFPVLTILGRLQPTPNYTELEHLHPLVLACLKTKQWKVRETAARALPSILSSKESILKELQDRLEFSDDLNEVHGSLMAVKQLLPHLDDVSSLVLAKMSQVLQFGYAIIREYLVVIDGMPLDKQSYLLLHDWFLDHLTLEMDGAKQLAASSAAQLLLPSNLRELLPKCLESPLYEVQNTALDYCGKAYLTDEDASFVVGEVWKLVDQKLLWDFTKAKALQLLNTLVKNEVSEDRIRLLLEGSTNKPVRLATVEALGPMVAAATKYFEQWYQAVNELADDDNEYPERSAALKSLISFDKAYVGDDATIKLSVVALLFEYLSDDDDDLRMWASEHVSRTELGLEYRLVPVVAESRLTSWIVNVMKQHTETLPLLLNRFRFFDSNIQLKDMFKQDLLLFGRESQNLYRDGIDHSLRLNEILDQLDVDLTDYQRVISRNVDDITRWFECGAVDGCLGWSLDENKLKFVYDTLRGAKSLGLELSRLRELSLSLDLQPVLVELIDR